MKSSCISISRRPILGAWLLGLTLLGGCASVKNQAYNAWNNVKSLVVIERTAKESYGVDIVAHPTANFGLVGTLVANIDLSAKSSRLTQALDPSVTALQRRLAIRLAHALNNEGYDSSVIPMGDSEPAAGTDVAAVQGLHADAYITLDLQARYVAAGPSSAYIPYVKVRVAQNDSHTGQVLYQDTLTYGYEQEHTQSVYLPSDARYRFKDMDTLLADPVQAREGLQAGVDAIVAQIATDLQR